MKRILIALDYEPSAREIAQEGHDLARATNAETILLHVVPESSYYSSRKYSPILGFETLSAVSVIETDNDSALIIMAENFLEITKRGLGDNSITILVKTGDPGENILTIARDVGADMIVIGTHHKKGINKMLSGSVTEKVFQGSSVPLLIIPVKS